MAPNALLGILLKREAFSELFYYNSRKDWELYVFKCFMIHHYVYKYVCEDCFDSYFYPIATNFGTKEGLKKCVKLEDVLCGSHRGRMAFLKNYINFIAAAFTIRLSPIMVYI